MITVRHSPPSFLYVFSRAEEDALSPVSLDAAHNRKRENNGS